MGEPARVLGFRPGAVLAHEIANPVGIDGLPRLEGRVRTPPEAADQIADLLADDALAEDLVGQPEVGEEVVVEEVAEGAVSDVVKQSRHAQELFDQRPGRGVGKLRLERWVELLGEAAGQVHGAQRMLEAAVLRGGEDPARRLQLGHAPQPLHPR